MRRLWIVAAAFAIVAVACADDTTPAASPSPDAVLDEVTLDECVIDQGTVAPAEPTGEPFTTLQAGKLIVGSDTAFPPFESIDDGEAVGFDVDLITEVAERIGDLEVEVQTANFDTIFTALASKKFDVVISAVTIKESRKQTVDFSDPYFTADQSLAVAADGDVAGVDDLEGLTVGVQEATTGADCADNALKAKGKVEEVRTYPTAPDAFSDLAAGRVDAVLVDLPTAKQIVEDRTGIELVQIIRTSEEYGIAVGKHNPDLRVAINEALADIRGDGTYRDLFVQWFGTEPPAE